MLSMVRSAALVGVDAVPIDVECDVGDGLPSFDAFGLPELSVREARVRVRSAIRHADVPFPKRGVVVNLAPADLRKDGTSYDLPVALAVLMADGQLPHDCLDGWLVVGELSLTGNIRAVPGVLAVAELAKRLGLRGVICPKGNVHEARVIDGIEVRGATDLAEIVQLLRKAEPWPAVPDMPVAPSPRASLCWSDVRGHAAAKRALEIAAAGGHNVVLVGQPGTGKTMLARRLPTILPPLTRDEAIASTKIFSAAGLLGEGVGLLGQRPFRAPHYTCSAMALLGGGSVPRPGEVSLARNGVLFLDELAEFPRHVLESLRQPVEDHAAVITRARQAARFPAKFMLVASLTPCPCGYMGASTHACICSPVALERYWARLSEPLLNRIDIQVQLQPLTAAMLRQSPPEETSAVVQARVVAARSRQTERYAAHGGGTNSSVSVPILRQTSPLAPLVHDLLLRAMESLGLPPRAHDATWRVARTIADLDGQTDIGAEHVAEALQYRHMDAPQES